MARFLQREDFFGVSNLRRLELFPVGKKKCATALVSMCLQERSGDIDRVGMVVMDKSSSAMPNL